MTDLVLINPAAAHGLYGPLGSEFVAVEPPLFCRLIACYIRDRGYEVKIIDAEALHLPAQAVAKMVDEINPTLVCIAAYGHQPSASSQQMFGAREVAEALAASYSQPHVIMVGGHPSALPGRTLREEVVEYVGVGEGPLTILGLLRGDDFGAIPGLVYWNGPLVVQNKSAPSIELSELRGDAWDLLPMDKYRAHQWQCLDDLSKRQPYASIYTSLNCPFACSFCCIAAPFGDHKYRTRDPKSVVDEIEHLYSEYGVSTIKITDEMFVLRPNHYLAICQGLIDRGLGDKLNVWSYARVDTVKPETLSVIRKAGIRWLALGIESGSKHVRDGANKKMKTEDIIGTVRAIQSHGINVIGNFMVGLPDDTAETMKQTYDLAIECMPDWSNWYCFPKGTPVYTPSGARPIESLRKNDFVLSQSGRTRVVRPLQRKFSGWLYSIKARYLPSIEATPEHPILVSSISHSSKNVRQIGIPRWSEPKALKPFISHFKDHDAVIVPKAILAGRDTFVDFSPFVLGQVGGGRVGGQLGEIGRRFLVPWALTNELAELFGWYVAEGSRFSRKNNQIGFSLGANEPENVDRVRLLVEKCFGYKTQILSGKGNMKNVRRISLTSKVLIRALPAIFGETSLTKHAPDFIMNAPADKVASFLLGYIAGDGTSHPNEKGQFAVSTASEVLARQLILLFMKIGIIPGCLDIPANERGNKLVKRQNRHFRLSWTTGDTQKHYYYDENAFYIPIKSISRRRYNGKVYNIETGDHTYAMPFIVHNCTMAYPGSALYTQALKEGRKLPPNWKSFSQHNEDTFPLSNENLTSAEILKFRDEAFTAFFTDPRYLSHVERKFGREALEHVRSMTTYKLKRKLLEAA
jgi:anaerobic magnesium-protoporphyrin IX monomethyl ester cyclase